MLTFLFLVSLTATTVLLLAIAAEEVARVTRALFARSHDEIRLGGATAFRAVKPHIVASADTGELRQLSKRSPVARGVKRPDIGERPDQAA